MIPSKAVQLFVKQFLRSLAVHTAVAEAANIRKKAEGDILKKTNEFLNGTVEIVDNTVLGTYKVISGLLHGAVDIITLQAGSKTKEMEVIEELPPQYEDGLPPTR